MSTVRQQIWCLILDAACTKIVQHLEDRGHRPIMLKGATIASWIYPDPSERVYSDLDILVPPGERQDVVAALREIGFRSLVDDAMLQTSSPEEEPLVDSRGVRIDLHVALKGVGLDPERAWHVLDRHTAPCSWSGFEVRALEPAARAMHLALHVAQRGLVDTKAARDLEIGLAVLDRPLWHAAARLADELEATGPFGAALDLLPEGRELLEELAVESQANLETHLRVNSASTSALFLEKAMAAGSWRKRLQIVRGRLFPSADWLRLHRPTTTRTRTGLLAARLRRPVEVMVRLPRAAWERHTHERRIDQGQPQPRPGSGGGSRGGRVA
jgi:hypothetical protein